MLDILTYILIGLVSLVLIVCLSIATYADSELIETFNKINKVMSSSFTIASDFAVMASMAFLSNTVHITKIKGFLTDAYSPRNKIIYLSDDIYQNSSVAALAIAAHEMGHALQDYEDPNILRKKAKMSRISKILGYFIFPIFIIGIALFIFLQKNIIYSILCLVLALFIFVFALAVKVQTIKVEIDASKKAILMLHKLDMLNQEELILAKKMLRSALLTYIADFLRSILGWTMLTRKSKIFGG